MCSKKVLNESIFPKILVQGQSIAIIIGECLSFNNWFNDQVVANVAAGKIVLVDSTSNSTFFLTNFLMHIH